MARFNGIVFRFYRSFQWMQTLIHFFHTQTFFVLFSRPSKNYCMVVWKCFEVMMEGVKHWFTSIYPPFTKVILYANFSTVFGSTKTFSCILFFRFYKEKFEDYPKNRKAVIPYLLWILKLIMLHFRLNFSLY